MNIIILLYKYKLLINNFKKFNLYNRTNMYLSILYVNYL